MADFPPVVCHPAARRFTVVIDGHTAFVAFVRRGDRYILFTHTEVPDALGGRGVGSHLAASVLAYARERRWVVVPLCPFMAAYIQRHPAWMDLVLPGFFEDTEDAEDTEDTEDG